MDAHILPALAAEAAEVDHRDLALIVGADENYIKGIKAEISAQVPAITRFEHWTGRHKSDMSRKIPGDVRMIVFICSRASHMLMHNVRKQAVQARIQCVYCRHSVLDLRQGLEGVMARSTASQLVGTLQSQLVDASIQIETDYVPSEVVDVKLKTYAQYVKNCYAVVPKHPETITREGIQKKTGMPNGSIKTALAVLVNDGFVMNRHGDKRSRELSQYCRP